MDPRSSQDLNLVKLTAHKAGNLGQRNCDGTLMNLPSNYYHKKGITEMLARADGALCSREQHTQR
jgi:hypothetical protein